MQFRFVFTTILFAAVTWADAIPSIGSGTLVAHFRVSNSSVARDSSGNVISWTADNNSGIVLNAAGTNNPGNITYSATGMNGAPEIVVNDFTNQNRYMTGAIGGTRTATTIFWLGFYQPGRGGSLGDGAGQYLYSYGADGADGSQMDHQIDGGNFEMFGGAGTQTGNSISSLNGVRTVWTTYYGQGTGNSHSAFAGTTSLGIPATNGGNYSVSGNLILFGFQGSTAGVSPGFNFVGNIGELIIYDGIVSDTDATAVRTYLAGRAAGDLGDPTVSAIPEPGTWAMFAAAAGLLAFRRKIRG